MPLAYPRPFLLGQAFQTLNPGPATTEIVRTNPNSAGMWLRGFLASYARTEAGGAQTSPELSFRLFVDGLELTGGLTLIPSVTTPAGAGFIRGVLAELIWVPPLSVIKMIVAGQTAAPVPATFSVTYVGRKTWERY